MTRSSIHRVLRVLLTAALFTVGLPLVAVRPAGALEQKPIVLSPNDRLEINYDPILVPNPANEADDPETCRTAPYCFTIPLHLNRPADLRPEDEFTVRIRMSWQVDVEDIEVPVQGEVTSNDMDMKIWDSPYVATNPETGESTEPVNEGGATGSQPEKTSMNTPPHDDYFIVVTNFVGLNRGFTLTLTWEPEVFEAPYEDLGGAAGPRDLSGGSTTVTPSFIASDGGYSGALTVSGIAGSLDPTVGPQPTAVTAPALSPLAVDADDFINADGDANLESQLVDEARRLTARPASTVRPARPVRGVIVFLWLVVVPVLLLVASAAWLIRRRPAALAI